MHADRIVHEAREDHPIRQPALGDQPSNPLELAATADQDQRQPRESLCQAPERVDKQIDAFDRIEAADATDDEVGGAESETLAAHRRLEQEPFVLLDVHAVDDDDALLWTEEPEPEALEVSGARDADDEAAPAREPALQREVEGPGDRAVVRVVQPVKGVNRRHPHPARRRAAVEPGPFAVGVHDVDPESRDRPTCEREMARAESPVRQLDDMQAELAETIEEGPVARRADDELELIFR